LEINSQLFLSRLGTQQEYIYSQKIFLKIIIIEMKIGSGSSGNVYRPYPIQCSNIKNLIPARDYVGKVASKQNLSIEDVLEAEKMRKEIDPENKFTIPYLGCCQSNPENQHSPLWQRGKYNIQYVYSFGGKKLKISENLPTLEQMFNFAKNLAKMNKAGYSHLDIKEDNILINGNGDLVLIDFDRCLAHKDIYHQFFREKLFLNIAYYAWPPEINFCLNKAGKYVKSVEEAPLEFEYLWKSGVFTKSKIVKRINKYLASKDYYNLMLKIKPIDYEKIDMYSFGIMLKFLYENPSPEFAKLIRKAIEPVPSLRIDWDSFLNEFEKIKSAP
jgi:serine/threonine protein kinase